MKMEKRELCDNDVDNHAARLCVYERECECVLRCLCPCVRGFMSPCMHVHLDAPLRAVERIICVDDDNTEPMSHTGLVFPPPRFPSMRPVFNNNFRIRGHPGMFSSFSSGMKTDMAGMNRPLEIS